MRIGFDSIKAGGSIMKYCAVFVVLATGCAAASTTTYTKPPSAAGGAFEIDLQQRDPNMLYATGEGAMPSTSEEPNRARAYLQAKGYAKMQAIANLVQSARGTLISYKGTGRDYVAEEDVTQEINGVVDNVKIVSERKRMEGKDAIVEVVVQAPVPEHWRTQADAKPTGAPGVVVASAIPSASWATKASSPLSSGIRAAKNAPFTSLIVDARGLNVMRSMSPKILKPNGQEVWGTVKVDYDFVADHGIAAYTRGLEDAYANQRAGDNPLVLKAIRKGSSPSNSDVVISSEDADYLLRENKQGRFLEGFRVVFVVDAGRL